MSSPARRAELAALYDLQCQARDAEQARKDALSMMDRIDEVGANEDVKDILRRICEHIGME